MLPVENPRYIFVRENAATMEESYKSFHQEEGIIVVQDIINTIICSTSTAPWYSNGFIIMTEEEEEKLTRLEKRLVATSTSTIKLSNCWVFMRKFTRCWDTYVGCNSPTECR
jgi:hypothetical protein